MVKPFRLFHVEFRATLAATVEREGLNQLFHGEDFLLGARIPAQQGQHVDKRLGIVAGLLVTHGRVAGFRVLPEHRKNGETEAVAVALAEFAVAVGFEQQRQVGELRSLPAKSLVEHDMERHRGQPFLATDDMADFHQMVIDDVGQVVGRHTVALEQDLVVQGVGLHFHLAANQVVHDDFAVFRNHETHRVRRAVGHQFFDFFFTHCQAVAQVFARLAIVDESLLVGFGLLAVLVEFLGGVEGDVGAAFGQEFVAVLLVKVFAVALLVGAVFAAHIVAFVELDAAPIQGLHDVFLGSWHEARLVGVLNAENHFSAVLFGKQVVI